MATIMKGTPSQMLATMAVKSEVQRSSNHDTPLPPRARSVALMRPKFSSKRKRQAKAATKAGTAHGTISATR